MGAFGKGLAVALVTQRMRHIFSPDAIAYSINGTAGTGAGIKKEGGFLRVKAGNDKGKVFKYSDVGVGANGASVSATAAATKLYYSGGASFSKDVFYGLRGEFNVGVDVGVSIGTSALYSKVKNTSHFVIGYGYSLGVGVSATVINLNYGKTSEGWE